MIRRTMALAIKEFLQLRRDWRTLLTLIGMPMVLLMIYGYALTFDVKDIRLVVVDRCKDKASRHLIQSFLTTNYFTSAGTRDSITSLDPMFNDGSAQAALIIPENFQKKLALGQSPTVQFVLDGSDSQTAGTVLGYARQIVNQAMTPTPELTPRFGVRDRLVVWYNPNLDSTVFLVPGLLAFILMVTTVIATALAVVREKERGTMESLRATPITAVELLLGKSLPYLVVASVAAAGAMTAGSLLFHVPMNGSMADLTLVTLLFLAGGLGWGVFISTLAETQQVAFQAAIISAMLPTILLSGFIFPIASMPEALQWVSTIVPARYFIEALREIVLKGAGFSVWWDQALALLLYGLVVLSLATIRTVRSL